MECDDPGIKDKITDKMRANLARKMAVLLQHGVNEQDIVITITAVKTVSKREDNPFYRQCEMSYTMPGMTVSAKKNYEIYQGEDGDIRVKLIM